MDHTLAAGGDNTVLSSQLTGRQRSKRLGRTFVKQITVSIRTQGKGSGQNRISHKFQPAPGGFRRRQKITLCCQGNPGDAGDPAGSFRIPFQSQRMLTFPGQRRNQVALKTLPGIAVNTAAPPDLGAGILQMHGHIVPGKIKFQICGAPVRPVSVRIFFIPASEIGNLFIAGGNLPHRPDFRTANFFPTGLAGTGFGYLTTSRRRNRHADRRRPIILRPRRHGPAQ